MNAASGMNSVRISSKNTYNHGLFILDLDHMPDSQYSTRPSFWTFDPNCSNNAKNNIITDILNYVRNNCHEASNVQNYNVYDQLNHMLWSNCGSKSLGQLKNSGYGNIPDIQAFIGRFNAAGGGVYAMEWTSTFLRAWLFTRSNIPSDIKNGHPDPSTWGTPIANLSPYNFDRYFRNVSIFFDTTLYNNWAGSVTDYFSAYSGNSFPYFNYANNYLKVFDYVYWLINSLNIYQNHSNTTPPINPVSSTPGSTV
ncbi:hypothetical protein FO519_010351, partial [Halicephalobus sp. NKZ332]